MAETADYQSTLSAALEGCGDWLEKTELPKLKEEFRGFHTAFFSLYTQFIRRKLLKEDPYKQEAKIVDIEAPDTGAFNEAERLDQLSQRFSFFDNQLDFLVNFYQFSLEFITLDKIKRILGLVKFVDWIRFSPAAPANPVTKAAVEMVNLTKSGADQLSTTLISDALNSLSKSSTAILGYLKEVSDFNRESYKLEVRTKVTSAMPPQEAVQISHIKKKFAAAMPGKPFYPDLVEEVIREDYSKDGPALREKALKLLAIPDAKPKAAKTQVSLKATLIDGFSILGSIAPILEEILPKLEENHELLQDQKRGFWEKIKKVLQEMANKEPPPVIYEVEHTDNPRSAPVKEKVDYHKFVGDLEQKAKNLANIRGGNAKLEAADETQLESTLERYIREIQGAHKILTALDDFFKSAVDKLNRSKVKGIKPELATIKNALVKANQKRYEFSAQKEEEEQFKRLGITSGT